MPAPVPLPVAVPVIVTDALKIGAALTPLPVLPLRTTPWLPLPVAVALAVPVSEIVGGVGEKPLPRLMRAPLKRPTSWAPLPPPVPLRVMLPDPVLLTAAVWLMP